MEDPLEISKSETLPSQCLNKSGRPNKSNVIQFSPQPQSIISQLLNEINSENSSKVIKNAKINLKYKLYDRNDQIQRDAIESLSNRNIIKKKISTQKNIDIIKKKQYMCEYPMCTYNTKVSSNLKKHSRTHTSEKPYMCDQCAFRTSFINSLNVHKRIHTSVRPYACKYCSYKCNSSSNLKKHCLQRHQIKQK